MSHVMKDVNLPQIPKHFSVKLYGGGGFTVNFNEFVSCAARLERRGNLKIRNRLCLQQRITHFYQWTSFFGRHSRGVEVLVVKEGLPILVAGTEPRPYGHLPAHISQRGHPTVSIYINNLCVCVRMWICI